MNSPIVSRRHFVKTFALGTAVSALMGKPWQVTVLADIMPADSGLLRIRLSDYPPLLQDFGSVRIGVTPLDNPTTPLGSYYPIIVSRNGFGEFYALDSACRHAGCVVLTFNEFDSILCPCHGSSYAIDGSVLGGPTVSPLLRYPLNFDGVDMLTIEVPNLGYRVNSATVQDGAVSRLKLDFPTFKFVEYELRFRERIRDEWAVVPFSLTADGPTDQWSLTGDNHPAALFVNRTASTGFYSVAIKILDLTPTNPPA